MIKKTFLNYKSKAGIVYKEHGSYSEASNIGILYNADQFSDEEIKEIKLLLQEDNKNVAWIGYADAPSEDNLIFHKKDISYTGRIKNDRLSFFVNQPFDFLISLDTSENINYKYILAISKASCKIGFETKQYYDFLQLALKIDENQPNPIEDIIRYLKMI